MISMMIDMAEMIPTMNDEIIYGMSSTSFVALVVAFGIGISLSMIYFCLEVMVKAFNRDSSVEIFGKKN